MLIGNWLFAQSPSETAATLTNEISEIIPIKYALASDIATALDAQRSWEADIWVRKAQVTHLEISNLWAQVQALGPRRITSDERSNSVLVMSSTSDLPKIKEIISELDVVLSQVLLEGVVLQFPLSNNKDSPRSRQNSGPHLPTSFIALTNIVALSTIRFNSIDTTTKTNPPGSQFSYEATLTADLDALVTSLANSQKVRILQRPRIQTSVGVPATMFVGSGRAYPSGSYTCGCPAVSSLDAGIRTDIVCLLTADGTLLTDIQTTVDKFVGKVTIQNVGDVPVTESNRAQAHVAVHDRQIIALGGLVQAEKESIFSEVEAFDKVPLAGHLLNRIITSPTHTKKYELMVLIRPIILPTPERPAALASRDRMPSIRSLEAEFSTEQVQPSSRRAAASYEIINPFEVPNGF